MNIYHYTHFNHWRGIKKGTYVNKYEPGLAPNLPLGQIYRPARDIKAIYALFEPQPDNWINNPYFKNVWDLLRGNVGKLLLEIDVDPKNETTIYVVDRGHIEGFLYEDKSVTPNRYLHKTREKAEKAYFESQISLNNFLKEQGRLNFTLPEIILTKTIPLERISISEQQPLLEKSLRESLSTPMKEELLTEIDRTEELTPWIDKNRIFIDELKASLGIIPQNEGKGRLV